MTQSGKSGVRFEGEDERVCREVEIDLCWDHHQSPYFFQTLDREGVSMRRGIGHFLFCRYVGKVDHELLILDVDIFYRMLVKIFRHLTLVSPCL